MNPIEDKYIAKLHEALERFPGDNEAIHGCFDDIALEFLEELGHGRFAQLWGDISNEVGFWYA